MKKVTMTVTAVGLIAALSFTFFIASNADWALSVVNKHSTPETKTYAKTYTVEKNGVTKTVEALQELPPGADAEQPPPYDPSDREWAGDPQTWAQLKKVIRDAFQADREVKLYANRGRGKELQGNLASYFSASSGELQRRQDTNDIEIQSALAGYGRSKSVITKMDFKGISVQDDKAIAVIDIWFYTSWKDFNTNKDDGGGETGEQHTVTLEQENNKWLITKDLWVFMPGYGP